MCKRYFLPFALVLSAAALVFPAAFVWGKPWIPYFLGIIMFGMGLTLQPDDFIGVWRSRGSVLLGITAQYTVMPLLAWLISTVLNLPDDIVIGMVLLGACPGGTASNVMVYLAGGRVALSVTMTLMSTLLAPLVTPAIVSLIANRIVEVPFGDMMLSIFWIVFLPVVGGLVIRRLFGKTISGVLHLFPCISMITIAFVIAVIMGLNREVILNFPVLIILAVILHNSLGLLTGYGIGVLFRCDEGTKRAIAIEVGMQNSGLAVALASEFFSAASALPGALFSLWHNISGIGLARYWSSRKA